MDTKDTNENHSETVIESDKYEFQAYCHNVVMTDEEKLEMYMKCTKTELAKMLIESTKAVDNLISKVAYPSYPTFPIINPAPWSPNEPVITYGTDGTLTKDTYDMGFSKGIQITNRNPYSGMGGQS